MPRSRKYRPWVTVSIFLALVFTFIIFIALPKSRRPSVILITMDSLRPDHLGCYGYRRDTSPNIDKFAGGGTVFLNAVAQATNTAPSLASILTSAYPERHRVFLFGNRISDKTVSLTSVLKNNGYETGFLSSHPGAATIGGFEDDFDTFYTAWTFREDTRGKSFKVTEINSRIIKWLKARKKKQFFLWVHYLEPHYPMNPPAEYKDFFSKYYTSKPGNKVKLSRYFAFGSGGIPLRLAATNDYITDLGYYVNLYDASVRYADNCVGNLLESLRTMGLADNTLVIIASDHGESMGEHNLYFSHSFNVYEELIRVPLIIRLPTSAPQGRRVASQVQLIDVAPTILEILKINKPSAMQGKGFVSLWNGSDLEEERFAFSSVGDSSYGEIAVRTNAWKLIYYKDTRRYGLYDLMNDPKELNNLLPGRERQLELLKNKLGEYLKQAGNHYKAEIKIVFDEETRQRLRSLGYIE